MSTTLSRSPPKHSWAPVKYSQTSLGSGTTSQGTVFPGGLDLTTPSLRLQPGALRDALNFEVAPFGGYRRVDGYERFDGQTSPSDATFTLVQMTPGFEQPADFDSDFNADFAITPSLHIPVVGDVVTQDVSGATGTVIAVVTVPFEYAGTPFVLDQSLLDGPDVLGGEGRSYIVLTDVTGNFDNTNQLTTAGFSIGSATELTISLDAKSKAIYTALAADSYRALIQKPPGAGPILGVVAMAFAGVDQVYAFRGNVGNTAALLYRATAAGWVLVPYLNLISFTAGGTSVPLDGDTLTQNVVVAAGGPFSADFSSDFSGVGTPAVTTVTATVRRVMWQSGAWAGNAVGQFVITAPIGGNFAAGAATTASGATVTLSGPPTQITMRSGGRFEFEKCNFSGQLITRRIYGCDGVNPAFEFDGVTLAPILTGLLPDRPSHIRFHKNFLFLSQEASLIYCAAGNPFKWTAIDGGGEIATGDTVTGMITLPGSQTTATLGVFLRTNSAFLYGTDPTTFNFVTFNSGIGAVPYSIQNLFDTFFLDDLGVVTLKTTLNWGNFLPSTLTKNLLPFIQRERGNLKASSVNRERSQYRLFFGDGYALYCTVFNQQYLGAAPVLFQDVIISVDTTNNIDDSEVTYAGSQSGYVYRLDVGTSFDGEPIPAYIVTAWDAFKSPRILKRYRAASIEVQGDSYSEFDYGYQLGYDSDQLAQLPAVTLPLSLGSIAHWDSFVWDSFVWDGTGLSPSDIDETGTAENIRVMITSGTNYIAAYTIDSIMHHYSMRRGMRV